MSNHRSISKELISSPSNFEHRVHIDNARELAHQATQDVDGTASEAPKSGKDTVPRTKTSLATSLENLKSASPSFSPASSSGVTSPNNGTPSSIKKLEKTVMSQPGNFDHRFHAQSKSQAERILASMSFESLNKQDASSSTENLSKRSTPTIDKASISPPRHFDHVMHAQSPEDAESYLRPVAESQQPNAAEPAQSATSQTTSSIIKGVGKVVRKITKSNKTPNTNANLQGENMQRFFIVNALSRATSLVVRPRPQIGSPKFIMSTSNRHDQPGSTVPAGENAVSPQQKQVVTPTLFELDDEAMQPISPSILNLPKRRSASAKPDLSASSPSLLTDVSIVPPIQTAQPAILEQAHTSPIDQDPMKSSKNATIVKPRSIPKTDPILSEALSDASNAEGSVLMAFLETKFDQNVKIGPNSRTLRRAQLEKQMKHAENDAERRKLRQDWLLKEGEHMRLMRQKITINDFEIIRTLGHGGFGVVRLVREKTTGEVYAMKILKKAEMLKRHQEAHVRAERDLLSIASEVSDWTVRLIYTFQDDDYLYFVLEYMPGGDLLGLLIKLDIFKEDFARFYCAEMILAIEEVHKLGMIHRDIKPDNFLFDSEGHLRLADFGLATDFRYWSQNDNFDALLKQQHRAGGDAGKHIDLATAGQSKISKSDTNLLRSNSDHRMLMQTEQPSDPNNPSPSAPARKGMPQTPDSTTRKFAAFSIVGTNNYIAPEVLIGEGYDKACDWWSMGVILFEMLFGYPPFCAKTPQQTKGKVLNWRQTLRFPSQPFVSMEARDLICRLICSRDRRLGTKEIVFSNPEQSMHMQDPSTASNISFSSAVSTYDAFMNRILGDGDAEDIKSHPWFSSFDWSSVQSRRPPFVPELRTTTDSSYFEHVDEAEVQRMLDTNNVKNEPGDAIDMRKKMAFVGFTYRAPKAASSKPATFPASLLDDIERDLSSEQSEKSPDSTEAIISPTLKSMSESEGEANA